MKRVVLILALLTLSNVHAAEQPATYKPLTAPQNIMFENCTRIFAVGNEKLFYLTLAAISANKFNIDEIQTANGYIIFSVNKNKYLATVGKIDGSNSILKITPCNNVYYFPAGIIINTFKYIDMNLNIIMDVKST